MDINYSGIISEREFATAVVTGTARAGCAALLGWADDSYFTEPLLPIRNMNGIGIPTLKPWKNEKILEKN